jgi:Tol biopolymer transport system component
MIDGWIAVDTRIEKKRRNEMTAEFSSNDENQVGQEPTDTLGSKLARFLPALVLAAVVVVIVGGFYLYERSRGTVFLSNLRPARIAFMSDRDGNWEVYIVDRDGENLLNLTNNPGNDGIPIQSPGQDQLTFASDRDGSGLDLFQANLDGSNVINITQTPDSNEVPIAWSPDVEHLVLVSDQNGSTDILLMQPTDGEMLNLSERDGAWSFDDWSSKTGRFILTIETFEGLSLFVTDLAGDTHQTLTDGSFPAAGGRWSPDEQKVAFMAQTPESGSIDIYVVDVADGEPINLTQSPSSDRYPRWSPDGSKIAFVSDRDGNSEIYVMDADGSNLTNLTNSPSDESIQGDFAWSPDGTQILFHSDRDANVEVYLMDADGSNQVNLTNSPSSDYGAVWVQ